MTEATVTDSTTDTLQSAAGRMWRQQTGSLLVMDNERLAGILTERDLLRAVEHEFDALVRERRLARIEHGDLD
jgi:CBS domain-containing protein